MSQGTGVKWTARLLWLAGLAGLGAAFFKSDGSDAAVDWFNAPGTAGFINLDAVKEAIDQAPHVAWLQQRVNEIYEGDGLVLFSYVGRFHQDGRLQLTLTACEDLDADGKPCEQDQDDILFYFLVKDGLATLGGAPDGVNAYYRQSWPYPAALGLGHEPHTLQDNDDRERTHLSMWTAGDGGHGTLLAQRSRFRASDAFSSQIIGNAEYESRMASQHGPTFSKAINNTSKTRGSWLASRSQSNGFKQELGNTRRFSAWGTRQALARSGSGTGNRLSTFSRSTLKSSFASTSRAKGFSSTSRSSFRIASGFGVG